MSFLETKALTRRFGGLTAVDNVDFRLEPGEIRAVIGPNGAGKTTLVSMICGRVPPSDGAIRFAGADITRLPPWERVARGIVYTFQITSVFRNLSCFENVALAAQRALTLGKAPWHAVDPATLAASVASALERVELHERHDTPAANLPYGHQRLLEVAMSLALKPKLLVLDEPTQGLSEAEITNFCKLVREIAADATILLIEHNMDVVMELAQRITVMSNGAILAEGTPAEITANAAVQQAYLGGMMLRVESLNCFYGNVQVLRDFALELNPGEVLCLLGRNGAGKTTLLKAIMGTVRPRSGRVLLEGTDLAALPAHEVPKRGIGYCPQGRRLFSELTVEENLQVGLMTRDRGPETLDRVLALFPMLQQRMRQRAGTLSGGEQQMLATARALCLEPKALLLDEPTEGLMPSAIATILSTVKQLKSQGVATILVEQRVEAALNVADRILFIENGRSCEIATPDMLRADPQLLHHYVGVGLKREKMGVRQS